MSRILASRGFIIAFALVVGFLIGSVSAGYLFYVWVPVDWILRDAPPRFLRFDPSGERPDYRDVYVARVANRYARDAQSGQPDAALEQALRALGVTTGDATPIEALAMARSAEQAARKENARDGDAPDQGWFTLTDQDNLARLVERLEQVKDRPPVIAESVITARRSMALPCGMLLLMWIAALGGVLTFVANRHRPAPAGAHTTGGQPSPVDPNVGSRQQIAVAAPTEPGVPSPSPYPAMPGSPPPSSYSTVSGAPPPASYSAMPGASSPPPYSAMSGVSSPSSHSAVSGAPPTMSYSAMPSASSPLPYSAAPGVSSSSSYSAVSGAPQPAPGESFINTFRAVYMHGDERLDEGFSISTPSGEFLGECGVSIADRIGLVSPAPVIALAIWVFDKSDFQSTTKVMLTPYAYRNAAILSKLAARGELIPASPHTPQVFEIVTPMLRVQVGVRDVRMQPLDGDPNGYFERAEFEFRVYRRLPMPAR